MIPDIQFPDCRRIDSRNKIARTMRRGDDELIGTNSIKPGHRKVRQFVRRFSLPARCRSAPGFVGKLARTIGHLVGEGETPATMAVADDTPLLLSPLKHRLCPAGPFFEQCRSRIIIFHQFEQTEMSSMRRGESGNFHVIPH